MLILLLWGMLDLQGRVLEKNPAIAKVPGPAGLTLGPGPGPGPRSPIVAQMTREALTREAEMKRSTDDKRGTGDKTDTRMTRERDR